MESRIGQYVFPEEVADPVVAGISQYGCYGQQDHQGEDVQRPCRREGSSHKEERISRQERHKNQACLDEYDCEQQGVRQCAVRADDLPQVNVEVKNEVDKEGEDVQFDASCPSLSNCLAIVLRCISEVPS
jgi:hypothetical protein